MQACQLLPALPRQSVLHTLAAVDEALVYKSSPAAARQSAVSVGQVETVDYDTCHTRCDQRAEETLARALLQERKHQAAMA